MSSEDLVMTVEVSSLLKQRHDLDKNHILASGMYISSPCGKFKVKCVIRALSFVDYEICILYPKPDFGEGYKVGEIVQLMHDKEQWSKDIKILSRNGNLIEAEIVDITTRLICHFDDGKVETHLCDFQGFYTNLYRITMDGFDKLDGNLFLDLPNGDNFPVRLRWKNSEEICLQKIERKK